LLRGKFWYAHLFQKFFHSKVEVKLDVNLVEA
jgi:hypothetical protein